MIEMERKYRELANACPSLSEIDRVEHENAMVFVHGTASCAIAGLKDLFSLAVEGFALPGPVYRFEHDTFVPITDNSADLARMISERLRVKRLLLVAHSRGGLVAVDSARLLADSRYGGTVSVYTFGTPFRGTPLVAIGQKALNVLMKLGEEIATSVPVPAMSALAKGCFYLLESPKLPRGIAAMHEQAEGLVYLQRSIDPKQLTAWASDFDVETGSAGFGATVEGILLGALGRCRHDLVVPTASALAFGRLAPLLRCAHVHYFRQPTVRGVVEDFLRHRDPVLAQPDNTAAAPAAPADLEAPDAASFDKLRILKKLKLQDGGGT